MCNVNNKIYKRHFKMVWTENMSKHEDPVIGTIAINLNYK